MEYAGAIDVRLTGRTVNLCARQAATILVKENVERSGRARSIEIYALCIHFGDIPRLASGNHEIVSGKIVIASIGGLEILGIGADRSRVV